MFKKICFHIAALLLLFVTVGGRAVPGRLPQSESEVPTVNFCDLLCKADEYDGKEVEFAATYVSFFEVSAFADSSCTREDNRTWVEFDRASVKASSEPDVLKKVEEQIYCCMWAGLSELRETKMVVTGVFHKPSGQGYGHDNEYRFMVTVKRVKEIKPTEKSPIPGFQ